MHYHRELNLRQASTDDILAYSSDRVAGSRGSGYDCQRVYASRPSTAEFRADPALTAEFAMAVSFAISLAFPQR